MPLAAFAERGKLGFPDAHPVAQHRRIVLPPGSPGVAFASIVMNKKAVAAQDLRLGMYVVELDRPWLDTRFPFQGFPLTSEDQIRELKSCCRTVFVDPDREEWKASPKLAPAPLTGGVAYENTVEVEAELPVATQIYMSCEEALTDLFEHLHEESEIAPDALTSAVGSLTQSIQRNPDAMLLFNSLRRKENYGLARALDTSILMITFGRFLQFATDRLEVLGLSGMLLDVSEPDLEPIGDFERLRLGDDGTDHDHVCRSVELIRTSRCLPDGLQQIVMLHHERQDGTGFPNGVAGEAISIDGAIAALVDRFSLLTTVRPDGKQLSPSGALTHLHNLRGAHFHDGLVEQFIQCIGVYPVGSIVELNTGDVAMVIAQNPVRRLQPRVTVILDNERRPMNPQLMLDLLREPKANGNEPYRIRRTLPKDELTLAHAQSFIAQHTA
jgi:HD-GYP domain-containing protein (c-di-GMP phosphodiesterase class II)